MTYSAFFDNRCVDTVSYTHLDVYKRQGKTFTMANVIEQLNRPTLIISHNKTLAAQLYGCLLYTSGASDRRLALFENIFPIPRGVSYNSYVLLDEKTVLLDTVDASVAGQDVYKRQI